MKFCLTLSLLLILFAKQTKAQVGIETTNPNATLDISAGSTIDPTDGLLIPRISNFPVTNPTAAQNGMLVFLTTTTSVNPSGFYYWNATNDSWQLLGNNGQWQEGTLNGIHYIFYRDAQNINSIPVRFYKNGQIGLGTSQQPEERIEMKFESDNNIQLTSSQAQDGPGLLFYNQNGDFGAAEFLPARSDLGSISGKVFNNGTSDPVVGISFETAQNQSVNNLPTKINFNVTDRNEQVAITQMSLESNGELRLNPLNSSNNPANDGVRPVPVFVNSDGGLTLNGDSQILVEPSVKYFNSDTRTNLNVSAAATASPFVGFDLPVLGSLRWNDDTTLFQIASNAQQIRVTEGGRYNIMANIYFNGDAPGASLECYVVVDPAIVTQPSYIASSIYANSYIGGSFNHNLSSISINEDIQIEAGDILSIKVKGNGNSNATITMDRPSTSMFQLTKIR